MTHATGGAPGNRPAPVSTSIDLSGRTAIVTGAAVGLTDCDVSMRSIRITVDGGALLR